MTGPSNPLHLNGAPIEIKVENVGVVVPEIDEANPARKNGTYIAAKITGAGAVCWETNRMSLSFEATGTKGERVKLRLVVNAGEALWLAKLIQDFNKDLADRQSDKSSLIGLPLAEGKR